VTAPVARPASSPVTMPARVSRRSVLLQMALAVAVVAGMVVAMAFGSSAIPTGRALAAVFGIGEPGEIFVVRELRLPRILVAVAVGACLGASGTLLQGLMRNPLASPDIVGVTGGASLATVLAIGAGTTPMLLPLAAGAGALTATMLLHLMSRRTGGGVRLVLIGIGLHAITNAGVTLVIARIPVDRLGAAEVWLAGSLHARNWTHVTAVLLGAAVTLPLAYGLLRRLAALELGDELAIGAGVEVSRTRALLLVSSALLAAVAVAVAGPIAFVALGAPHIARRLVGPTSAANLTTAALLGALLVLAADVVGQRLLAPTALPAGVVTAALGAPYLLWLLHRMGRK
jgi:iron complex transport system permease protein